MFSSSFCTPQQIAKNPAALSMMIAAQVDGERCLHTSTEINADEFANESADEYVYALVHDATDARRSPVGLFGVEIGDSIKRAWLRGPFTIDRKRAQFAPIANAAFDALTVHLGSRVEMFDAYVEASYDQAIEWYQSRGFERLKRHSVHLMDAPSAPLVAVNEVELLTPAFLDETVALAARAFPGGYLTREDFAAPATDERATLVLTEGQSLLGYVYMSYEPDTKEAQVENLAVLESMRRKGIARKLLLAGLYWAFTVRGAPRAALVVTEGNTNAEDLYRSVGFRHFATGQHLRLTRKTD
jgi:ribosomal protein S18 acetylase RimI-like enzyme